MRKIFSLVAILCLTLLVAACGGKEATDGSANQEKAAAAGAVKETTPASDAKRAIVVYYSRADENTGGVGYIEKGNTRILAEMIADMANADLYEIKPVKPYPKEYDRTTEIAKAEKEKNARPEIEGTLPDLSQYDALFLGYPIWWGDLPMIVYTFLEGESLSGKTVIPFCTHEGSGIGNTESFIENATKATVLPGLEMRGSIAQKSPDEAREIVNKWLAGLKY